VRIPEDRSSLLKLGLRLEYLTVGWNLAEGVIGLLAALAAGSVVLLGFSIDSFVEVASGFILIWRLRAEQRSSDASRIVRIEHLARRLVAGSLFALGAYVLVDATVSLVAREEPSSSGVGIALTSVSLGVMWWLARVKRTVAQRLGSHAMLADAAQTSACWWLSLVALGGLGLNAAFDWWWADPVAAIVAAVFIAREGVHAWRGDDCC
jgi:divalent metal cation (Fe/Co/Zn/Cd) transporter